MKNKKVCYKTKSPPSSLLFKGQDTEDTEDTTVKWLINVVVTGTAQQVFELGG